jgi:hypothetical protein
MKQTILFVITDQSQHVQKWIIDTSDNIDEFSDIHVKQKKTHAK